MKKILIAIATGALVLGAGVAPSHAINCHALNQGTGNAYHVHSANGNGLIKIAMACHFG